MEELCTGEWQARNVPDFEEKSTNGNFLPHKHNTKAQSNYSIIRVSQKSKIPLLKAEFLELLLELVSC